MGEDSDTERLPGIEQVAVVCLARKQRRTKIGGTEGRVNPRVDRQSLLARLLWRSGPPCGKAARRFATEEGNRAIGPLDHWRIGCRGVTCTPFERSEGACTEPTS